MEINTTGKRVKYARNQKGWTQQELSDRSGVPTNSISKLERGDQHASKYIPIMAEALDVNAPWLAYGRGPMTKVEPGEDVNPSILSYDEVRLLQHMDARNMHGPAYQQEEGQILPEISIPRYVMKRLKLKENECIGEIAQGHEMSTTIHKEDDVLIHINDKNLEAQDGNIFAFAINNIIRYQRVYTTLTGGIRLVSDNPNKNEYPDVSVPEAEKYLLKVVGRVRWHGSFV